ncbi:hypothetical protein ABWH74_001268 [Burkholderia vietnamiensis]|uniref:hypothetical protein n=1 Tax=Burkholderia cepacia complex TaxID=87882 RepID=UPI00112CA531|nr:MULTISPECIES: hypothetical protein [Burkholderia cepacia complex]MBR8165907.1 hypothetical protein [Burkholderia vietnamiensis]MCA8147948.1 hypothetical protein [Burkholderia vietnamiensis]MDN7409460.1 hypothetical protein [Burkholderia vietnamiensis]HDR9199713.1 hypothetical protein [Burkholderia vietnamiensis]HDR9236391.1 hypothetical protein [Burkholderia vietnamiensis]
MSDAFFIVPYQVKAEGKDVPPNEIQTAINSLANQMTTALNVLGNGASPQFAAAMLAWFNSLPTSLPATSGVLWNNGGTLAQS